MISRNHRLTLEMNNSTQSEIDSPARILILDT
jgi:hypothetical protein